MNPENPITTALVKTAQSPALARVSNQLALTDKLLTKPEEPFLIPYRKGNKWGFCDRNKNIVIDCVYDVVKPFSEGLAITNKGYVNPFGEIIIDAPALRLRSINSFVDGVACVRSFDTGDWAVINKVGKMLTPFKYENIEQSSEGILIASVKGDYFNQYILDLDGLEICVNKFVKPEKYPNTCRIGVFSEGYAACSIKRTGDLKYGYISKKGDFLIEPKFSQAEKFQSGLAAVLGENMSSKSSYWSYINKGGETVINRKLKYANPFYKGLASIKIEGEDSCSLINEYGDIIREFPNYGWIDAVSKGFSIAHDLKMESFKYINYVGEEVSSTQPEEVKYDPRHRNWGGYIRAFEEGMALVGSRNVSNSHMVYGFINTKGIPVMPLKYECVDQFRNGLCAVYAENRDKLLGYIDKTGNEYWSK